MITIVWHDKGVTESGLSWKEAVDIFGSEEALEDALDGSDGVVSAFIDEWDGQPDEAQEWYDFDPDC